jgi:hypothetical protein
VVAAVGERDVLSIGADGGFHEELGRKPWVDITWEEGMFHYGMWHTGGLGSNPSRDMSWPKTLGIREVT